MSDFNWNENDSMDQNENPANENNTEDQVTDNTEDRTEEGQNSRDFRNDVFGYQNNYQGGRNNNYRSPDNTGEHYSYGYSVNPKEKKSNAGAILVTLLLVAALFVGGFFVVKSILNKNNTNTDLAASTNASATTSGHTSSVTNEATEATGDRTVTLATASSDSKGEGNGSVIITDVSDVVKNVMPCVVAITDNLEVTTSTSYNPYYYYFYGNQGQQQQTEESAASGSGVIIGQSDTELLIVTNNHVVDNEGNYTSYTVSSTGLTVAFCDGSTASATIKGTDDKLDLAVVAVNLNDISNDTLSAIRIAVVGSSDDIEVGEGVIAIGNALGYGQSVTTGIVSAKEREVTIDDNTRLLLQTDAAINPGNSGGGLFNSDGELIGINAAKYSSESVEGMCFAIPISSVTDVIEDLMNRETVAEEDQGYLGMNGETVPSSYISIGYPKGVIITRIGENSPAAKAGLQTYDIITSINGETVTEMSQLKKLINSYPAGTTVEITFSRPDKDGRNFTEMTTEATLVTYAELNQQ